MATVNEKADIARWEELPDGYFFSIAEVAGVLNLSSDGTIRNAIKSGKLRAVRLSAAGKGPYRIKKQWLREYLEGCEVELPQKQGAAATNSSTGGGLLKHIKPTWIDETSQPSEQAADQSNGRKPRSSERSCGRECRR